jgi:hypothetical protein
MIDIGCKETKYKDIKRHQFAAAVASRRLSTTMPATIIFLTLLLWIKLSMSQESEWAAPYVLRVIS